MAVEYHRNKRNDFFPASNPTITNVRSLAPVITLESRIITHRFPTKTETLGAKKREREELIRDPRVDYKRRAVRGVPWNYTNDSRNSYVRCRTI